LANGVAERPNVPKGDAPRQDEALRRLRHAPNQGEKTHQKRAFERAAHCFDALKP
jgi:hypothetical protein